MIHIGDTPTGERIDVPIHHTGVFGASGVGKTKLLKYMMRQAVDQGFHVLIFDSRVTGPEFEGIGKELPFYIDQSTDPDILRSLLEGTRAGGKGNLEFYRGGFIEITEPEDGPQASDFADIAHNLEAKLSDKKRIKGKTRMMYREIQRDFNKLIDVLNEMKFSPNIGPIQSRIDNYPMTRMPTWKLPNMALQGLVVKSVVEWVLKHHQRDSRIQDYLRGILPLEEEGQVKVVRSYIKKLPLGGYSRYHLRVTVESDDPAIVAHVDWYLRDAMKESTPPKDVNASPKEWEER